MKRDQRRAIAIGGIGVVLIIFGSARAQDVNGAIKPTFQMKYYDVSGKNWGEIEDAITRSAPLVPGTNDHFEGVSTYTVTVGPDDLVRSGTCSADNVTVKLDLTVEVPRLSPDVHLTGQDQECWAGYDRSLTDHEEWHLRIAERDEDELLAKLRTMTSASCGEIARYAQHSIDHMKLEQAAYDLVSRHGQTQWRAWGLDKPASQTEQDLQDRCSG